MTYFDRNYELSESALSVLFGILTPGKTLTLERPFSCALQTGKRATITAIAMVNPSDLQFHTTEIPIPSTRIETDELMRLVDEEILPKKYHL